MQIYIRCPGDRSVGIRDANVTIDVPCTPGSAFDGYEGEEKEPREVCRDELHKFWERFFGEGVEVRFEDECPDCYRPRQPGQDCPNPNCISNVPANAD